MSTDSEKTLVIKNNRVSAVILPSITAFNHPEYAGGKMLLPGENDVLADYWEECKKIKAVTMLVACKILESKGFGKAVSYADGLDSLSKKEALAAIEVQKDMTILSDWSKQTKDRTLKKAISQRQSAILKTDD